jgi:hypothetical protein
VELFHYKLRAVRLNDRIKACKAQQRKQHKILQGQGQHDKKRPATAVNPHCPPAGKSYRRCNTNIGFSSCKQGQSQGGKGKDRPQTYNIFQGANIQPLFKVRNSKVRNVWSSSSNDDDDDEDDDGACFSDYSDLGSSMPRGFQLSKTQSFRSSAAKSSSTRQSKPSKTKPHTPLDESVSNLAIEGVFRAQAMGAFSMSRRVPNSKNNLFPGSSGQPRRAVTGSQIPQQSLWSMRQGQNNAFLSHGQPKSSNSVNAFTPRSDASSNPQQFNQRRNFLQQHKHAPSQAGLQGVPPSHSKVDKDAIRQAGSGTQSGGGRGGGREARNPGFEDSINSPEAFRRCLLDKEWDRYEVNQQKVADYLMSLKVH